MPYKKSFIKKSRIKKSIIKNSVIKKITDPPPPPPHTKERTNIGSCI